MRVPVGGFGHAGYAIVAAHSLASGAEGSSEDPKVRRGVLTCTCHALYVTYYICVIKFFIVVIAIDMQGNIQAFGNRSSEFTLPVVLS